MSSQFSLHYLATGRIRVRALIQGTEVTGRAARSDGAALRIDLDRPVDGRGHILVSREDVRGGAVEVWMETESLGAQLSEYKAMLRRCPTPATAAKVAALEADIAHYGRRTRLYRAEERIPA